MQRFHLKITRLALEKTKGEHNGAAFASHIAGWVEAGCGQWNRFGLDDRPRWISSWRAAIKPPPGQGVARKMLLAGQGV
jgi:hypothetical protein